MALSNRPFVVYNRPSVDISGVTFLIRTIDTTKLFDAAVLTTLTSTGGGIQYTEREGFARYVIQTDAPQIYIQSLTDTLGFPSLPGYNSTGLLVNGMPQLDGMQLGAIGSLGSTIYPLPAGTNTLQLIDGPTVGREPSVQQIRGTPNITYGLPIGSSHAVISPSAPAKRIVLLGDSIQQGYGLTDEPNRSVTYQSPVVLVRKNAAESSSGAFAGAAVTDGGASGYRFSDEASSASLRTASISRLTARLDGTAANLLVVELGENDWGGGVPVANYEADAGTWADAVHAAFPALTIVLQSLLVGNETLTFGSGGTRPQYRTALSNVASTRTSFCKYIDGLSLIPSRDHIWFYPDFTHLNTFGQVTYEANLRSALNALSLGY